LVTITLINAMEKSSAGFDPEVVLFQTSLRVVAKVGEILPYPRPRSAATSDQDEAEVRYLYRDSPIFARGHGVAATWRVSEGARCSEVQAAWMPATEVRAATFEIPESPELDQRYRDVEFLAFNDDVGLLQDVLSGVAAAFGKWL